MRLGRLSIAAVVLLAPGCAHSMYEWGAYEDSVFALTSGEGFDLTGEIDRLELQLERTQNKDRRVPPGFHAHLGYLHYMSGNIRSARGHFETEAVKFPESAHFVGMVLARMPPAPPEVPEGGVQP